MRSRYKNCTDFILYLLSDTQGYNVHWKEICKPFSRKGTKFVEECPGFQMEKSDHTLTKGKLQSTQISKFKWTEMLIDFIADSLLRNKTPDSILLAVDKAPGMVNLAP